MKADFQRLGKAGFRRNDSWTTQTLRSRTANGVHCNPDPLGQGDHQRISVISAHDCSTSEGWANCAHPRQRSGSAKRGNTAEETAWHGAGTAQHELLIEYIEYWLSRYCVPRDWAPSSNGVPGRLRPQYAERELFRLPGTLSGFLNRYQVLIWT
jgi:hypothetical protein